MSNILQPVSNCVFDLTAPSQSNPIGGKPQSYRGQDITDSETQVSASNKNKKLYISLFYLSIILSTYDKFKLKNNSNI